MYSPMKWWTTSNLFICLVSLTETKKVIKTKVKLFLRWILLRNEWICPQKSDHFDMFQSLLIIIIYQFFWASLWHIAILSRFWTKEIEKKKNRILILSSLWSNICSCLAFKLRWVIHSLDEWPTKYQTPNSRNSQLNNDEWHFIRNLHTYYLLLKEGSCLVLI